MTHGLIPILTLQLARISGLVRSIEVAELEDGSRSAWVLLIRGRGFTRILRDDPLPLPGVMRPSNWNMPRPMRFPSQAVARNYGESMGLLPRKKRWAVKPTT